MAKDIVLDVKDLKVEFDTYGGIVKAVRGVDFQVERGKTLGIVGESGCGKSVTMQSIMGLIPMPPGRITSGSAKLDGLELLNVSPEKARSIRGKEIGMIFQDPMSSMNPTMKIGKQIAETLIVHRGYTEEKALNEAKRLLDRTKIPEAHKRASQFPFEFSGGMLQRAIIAMALACKPKLLIADEPTTALDVTIQEQILDLLKELQTEDNMSIIMITHDLGVVARMADQVSVMYAGQVIESGSVDEIFYKSSHPYTIGLRQAMPVNDEHNSTKLIPIEGSPPDLFSPPKACAYYARCPYAMEVCNKQDPAYTMIGETHRAKCWMQDSRAPKNDDLHQAHL
ncbi:MAG: ABC transporter ATP-binding protein [Bdellovibrionota bacterium]|nr:ABC transporter ATP-binding protein [Bdellovibrionota bacterium]